MVAEVEAVPADVGEAQLPAVEAVAHGVERDRHGIPLRQPAVDVDVVELEHHVDLGVGRVGPCVGVECVAARARREQRLRVHAVDRLPVDGSVEAVIEGMPDRRDRRIGRVLQLLEAGVGHPDQSRQDGVEAGGRVVAALAPLDGVDELPEGGAVIGHDADVEHRVGVGGCRVAGCEPVCELPVRLGLEVVADQPVDVARLE